MCGNAVNECDAWVSWVHPIAVWQRRGPSVVQLRVGSDGRRSAFHNITLIILMHTISSQHRKTRSGSEKARWTAISKHNLAQFVMALSVDKELRVSLLLTGGVGFLGSVCLLQTIQLTQVHGKSLRARSLLTVPTPSCSTPTSFFDMLLQVKRVYVLVRGKKGLTAQQRVQKLLCGPLFHELHKQVGMCTRGARNPAHCKVAAVGMTRAAHCCPHASHRLQKVRPTCSARSRWWRETSSSPTWASPQQTSRPCCQMWRPSFTALPA